MLSNLFATVRAFFRGFALLSRNSATDTLTQHRSRIYAAVMLAVYYVVMGYYLLHHAKNAPKEQVSDGMMLFFQLALGWVFYMGFHRLVQFIQRDDVQQAFARCMERLQTLSMFALCRLERGFKASARVLTLVAYVFAIACATLFKWVAAFLAKCVSTAKRLFAAAARFGAGVLIVVAACSVEGCKTLHQWSGMRLRSLKRFADECVEAGQSARM